MVEVRVVREATEKLSIAGVWADWDGMGITRGEGFSSELLGVEGGVIRKTGGDYLSKEMEEARYNNK